MSTQTPIRFESLTKRYGAVTPVQDVSFDVRPGRITGLLGRNGAGKTTSLRALLGLVRPTSGRALLFGRRYGVDDIDPARVGVSLDGIGTNAGATAAGELKIWAASLGLPKSVVPRTLDEVGLADVAGRPVRKFSQGMRQRLALGCALLSDPEVLILDEPATGLDPTGIRWLRTILRERARRGVTVLVSSHMLNEVEHTVDDVVVLDRTVRYSGSLADFTADGERSLEDAFFDLIEGRQADDSSREVLT